MRIHVNDIDNAGGEINEMMVWTMNNKILIMIREFYKYTKP